MARSLQRPDQADKLFGSMRDRDVIMLSLRPHLCEIGGKRGIPKADIFGRIEKSKAPKRLVQ